MDGGWGDELCHQTRGLKDGRPECYQSCLDQDVRLSRSLFPSSRFPPGWAGRHQGSPFLPSSHSSLPSWLTRFSSCSPSLLPFWLFFPPVSSLCSILFFLLFSLFLSPPLSLLPVFIFLFLLLCVTPFSSWARSISLLYFFLPWLLSLFLPQLCQAQC